MNKLMGFYELQNMNIPSIAWKEYKEGIELDDNILWTIRTAVFKGNDFNLPRLIGKSAAEAMQFATQALKDLRENGIVVYYPYFVAEKSGNLNVFQDKVVIEAVKGDLWNLVTYSDRDVTIIYSETECNTFGNKDFFEQSEIKEILLQTSEIKRIFRNELIVGKSIMLEWSFAFDCNVDGQATGEKYLVFYEARIV